MILKKHFLNLIFFVFAVAVHSQSDKKAVFVNLNLKWKNEPLELNKIYHSLNDSLQISAFKFYISSIEIQFDDNSKFIENNSYHLIDIENNKSLKIDLLKNTNKIISQISFNVGVDSLASVSGAMSGDLDATNGMYWAWQSGFINMKIEGKSNSCSTRNNNFYFHIGGYLKPNYALRNVTINCKDNININGNCKDNININSNFNDNINLIVDLAQLFDGIDLKSNNSIMIPGQKAMKIADLSTKIFSLE